MVFAANKAEEILPLFKQLVSPVMNQGSVKYDSMQYFRSKFSTTELVSLQRGLSH